MKRTKKALALLLALALALTLAVPAMAVTRDDITITGPEGTVPFGEAFTLRVDVNNLPAGTEVVSYQWRVSFGESARIEDATNSILLAPGDPAYPNASGPTSPAMREYACTITFAEKDTDGEVINTFTLIRSIRVDIARERKMNFGELMKYASEAGVQFGLVSSYFTAYLLLPFFPITFLIGFFLCFFGELFN